MLILIAVAGLIKRDVRLTVTNIAHHARIQEFSSGGGGGGGPGQSDKKSSDNGFFSPQLILQKSNGQFQRILSFFKVPEGVQHFPGEGAGGPIAYSL